MAWRNGSLEAQHGREILRHVDHTIVKPSASPLLPRPERHTDRYVDLGGRTACNGALQLTPSSGPVDGPSAPAAEDKGLARLPGDQGCRNAEDIGIAADSEPLDLFSVTECHGQLCRGIREKSGDGDSLWVRQAHRVRPSRPPSRPGAGEAACRGPTSPSPRAAWEATHRRGPDLARKFGATSERARGTDCTRRKDELRWWSS